MGVIVMRSSGKNRTEIIVEYILQLYQNAVPFKLYWRHTAVILLTKAHSLLETDPLRLMTAHNFCRPIAISSEFFFQVGDMLAICVVNKSFRIMSWMVPNASLMRVEKSIKKC